jgi:hypothetical protein
VTEHIEQQMPAPYTLVEITGGQHNGCSGFVADPAEAGGYDGRVRVEVEGVGIVGVPLANVKVVQLNAPVPGRTPEPIVMENEGHKRTEHCPRWNWQNGSVSYGPVFSELAVVQEFLDEPPFGVEHGEMVERTITITPWEPVLPPGVLRLHEIGACEYGGIRVAELGEGVVEGYTVVAFTDDVDKALLAVRAHMVMVHGESPALSLFREDEPVRYWQMHGTCGCGDTCPHNEEEDHDGCKRTGLPPCWQCLDGGGLSWIGEACEKDAPGAVPVVEIEVGENLTRDEQVVVMRSMLGEAEKRLRDLSETCLAVKPTLDKPYSDAPGTTPWKRHVELYTRLAYDYAVEIRRHLNSTGTAS